MKASTGLKKRGLFLSLVILQSLTLTACFNKTTANDNAEPEIEIVRPALIANVMPYQGVGVKTFPAIINATEKTDLAFRVSGQLTNLPAVASQKVEKGALLALIDNSDFKNTLEDRNAKLNLAKTKHRQTLQLFKQKYASQLELDTVNSQLRAAKIAVKQAKANISYTRLHAPFSGVIAHVNVKNYQFVQPQQTIVQLQSVKELDVRFDVPESLIKSLRKIESFSAICGLVTLKDSEQKNKNFKACYKEHDSVPDSQTRTYPVLFSLSKSTETNLIPGMSVDFSIDLTGLSNSTKQPGLLIPIESVFDEDDKQWVWKLNNEMRVTKTNVDVDGIDSGMIRITKGLSANDQVIAAGVSYLSEGQKVRALSKERGL